MERRVQTGPALRPQGPEKRLPGRLEQGRGIRAVAQEATGQHRPEARRQGEAEPDVAVQVVHG